MCTYHVKQQGRQKKLQQPQPRHQEVVVHDGTEAAAPHDGRPDGVHEGREVVVRSSTAPEEEKKVGAHVSRINEKEDVNCD